MDDRKLFKYKLKSGNYLYVYAPQITSIYDNKSILIQRVTPDGTILDSQEEPIKTLFAVGYDTLLNLRRKDFEEADLDRTEAYYKFEGLSNFDTKISNYVLPEANIAFRDKFALAHGGTKNDLVFGEKEEEYRKEIGAFNKPAPFVEVNAGVFNKEQDTSVQSSKGINWEDKSVETKPFGPINEEGRITFEKSAGDIAYEKQTARLAKAEKEKKARIKKLIQEATAPIFDYLDDVWFDDKYSDIKRMRGVIFASKENGKNTYILRNATHSRNLLGVTKQIQHALGMRYDLPRAGTNYFGPEEGASNFSSIRQDYKIQRGTIIHGYVDKALKTGSDVEIDKSRLAYSSRVLLSKKKTQMEKQLMSVREEVSKALNEGIRAQEIVDYVRRKYPAGEGWKYKSEYAVSDYRMYASSVDILVYNEHTKEAVVLDIKTGKENIPYVSAQTSVYTTFIKNNDRKFKDYNITTGVIGFDSIGRIQHKELTQWDEKEVNQILYPSRDESGVGFFYKKKWNVRPSSFIEVEDSIFNEKGGVLPFGPKRMEGIFQHERKLIGNKEFVKSKAKGEGKVFFLDLETMPLKNNRLSLRSISMLKMWQYRDEIGNIRFAYNNRSVYERAFLSKESVNETSVLTNSQLEALSINKLTDAAVISFEKAHHNRKARIATYKDVLAYMKEMKHGTVIGHNIIDFDLGALFTIGLEDIVDKGGTQEDVQRYIAEFDASAKTISVIDTLDLAKILQEEYTKKVLPSISNENLSKFFSPSTYEKLNKFLHQSTADTIVTAKNFESLLASMSQSEQTILFKLMKDTGRNQFGYTVYKGSQGWQESEQRPLPNFRVALTRTTHHFFGTPYVFSKDTMHPIKRVKFKEDRLYQREAFIESANTKGKYAVYFKRRTLGGRDELILDMPLYDEVGAIEAAKYMEKSKEGGVFSTHTDTEDIVKYYIDRQNRDVMVISDTGEFGVPMNALDKAQSDKMLEEILQQAEDKLTKSITGIVTSVSTHNDYMKAIGKLAKSFKPMEAVALAKNDKFLKGIVGEGNEDIYTALKQALLHKAGATPEEVQKATRKLVTRGIIPDTDGYYASDKFTKFLIKHSEDPAELLDITERMSAYTDLYKYYGAVFGDTFKDFATSKAFAHDMIFTSKTPLSGFQKRFSNFNKAAKKYATAAEMGPMFSTDEDKMGALEIFFSSKLPRHTKEGWFGTTQFADFVNNASPEQLSEFKTMLSSNVTLFDNVAKAMGISDRAKGIAFDNMLSDYFEAAREGRAWEKPTYDDVYDITKKMVDDTRLEKEAAVTGSAYGTDFDEAAYKAWNDPWARIDREAASKKYFEEKHRQESLSQRERDKLSMLDSFKRVKAEYDQREAEKASMLKSAQKVKAEYDYDVAYPSRLSKENEKTTSALLLKQGMAKLKDTLNGTADAADKLTNSVKGMHDEFEGFSREEKRLLGAAFHTPFYNPERFFGTAYSQIGGIHSSLSGLIPNFMNTSITKMLTGGTQDYEQAWLSTKYGLKKADTLMPLFGSVLGAAVGGPNPASIAVGTMLGKGAAAITSQFIGLGREEKVEAAGLFFQSRFNKMGAILTAVTGALNMFAKALKIATVPILGGIGLGLYHYKRALANMAGFATPLTNLTGVSYGNYYQDLERTDLAYGMAKGTTNKIVEDIEFQKQGLFTLGRYDKSKLLSAAMLGVFGDAFIPNGKNGAANYSDMMNKLYNRMSNAGNSEKQRMMYLLNLYNPDMARQIQVRTDMTNFLSRQEPGSIFRKKANAFDITDNQRQEFRAITFFQNNFADSISKSLMKVAAGMYKWKGFDFMNALTGVVGRAGDYFAAGKYDEGLQEIADGIVTLMKKIGDTWKEVKDKLGVSSISDQLINKAKLIGYNLELVLLDIGDFALNIIEKIQGPVGKLGSLFMEQFSKFFEFVGTLRFDFDLEKLAKGQAGGIKAHWGYKIADYEASGAFGREALFGILEEYSSVEDFFWGRQGVAPKDRRHYKDLADWEKQIVQSDYDRYRGYGGNVVERRKIMEAEARRSIERSLREGAFDEHEAEVLNKLVGNYSAEAVVDQWRIAKILKTMNDVAFGGTFKEFLMSPEFLINGNKEDFLNVQRIFGYSSREVQPFMDVSSFTPLLYGALDVARGFIGDTRKDTTGKRDEVLIKLQTPDGKKKDALTITGKQIELKEIVDVDYFEVAQ